MRLRYGWHRSGREVEGLQSGLGLAAPGNELWLPPSGFRNWVLFWRNRAGRRRESVGKKQKGSPTLLEAPRSSEVVKEFPARHVAPPEDGLPVRPQRVPANSRQRRRAGCAPACPSRLAESVARLLGRGCPL